MIFSQHSSNNILLKEIIHKINLNLFVKGLLNSFTFVFFKKLTNMLEIVWMLFACSTAVLFLLYFLFSIVFFIYKKPDSEKFNQKNGVSVVICSKNEFNNLQSNLEYFLHQDYVDFEVIVVDDRSTDDTYDYLLKLKETEKKLRIVHIEETPDHINNKKYAITLGIKASKYDIILLSDADCQPAGYQWIKGMATPFANDQTELVLGYSQYTKTPGLLNAFIRYETLWTGVQYLGLALLGKPYMGVGRNLAYRKSLFLDNNGFGRYKHIVGGDDDLFVKEHAKKTNTTVVISPETIIFSKPKQKWGDFIIQKQRHLSVGKLYSISDKILLGLVFLAKIMMIASFVAVILSGIWPIISISMLISTYLLFLATLLLLKNKTGDNTNIWWFPFLDIMYIFYYLIMGLKVMFAKKIKWK